MNSIEQLPQEVAKSIAEFSGSFLCLNGLKEISGEAIKELGNFRGEHLQLQGLLRANEKVIYRTRLNQDGGVRFSQSMKLPNPILIGFGCTRPPLPVGILSNA